VSLPFFAVVLTLAPAVCALAVVAVGQIKPAPRYVLFALAALGTLVPAIFLLILAPQLSSGVPVRLALLGGDPRPTAVFSPVYRLDALGLYAGLGLVFIVTPLLLWMAWHGAIREESDDTPEEAPTSWAGIALALGVESAGLTALLADNILWLGLSWIVLAALAWGLGEVGSDGGILDRLGLALMLLGPLLWVVVLALPASTARSWSLYDLQGRGSFSALHVIMLAVVLALAGGSYPFSAWVRRRAALTTPAGLGAVVLVLLPLALFVGARTFAAAQDANGLWPQIGKATPPITGGIALVLLGSVTVAISGLLALERRDVRAAIAYLAIAQVGWGLVALGIGEPGSLLAIVVLLATSVFGLGAMLASVFAGGTLTSDIEPDGAGPHMFGTGMRPVSLFAWSLGALTLIGAPLFGGFVPRQMTSAAALQAGGLTIPLTGLAWAGEVLLALALLRMTAPALAGALASPATASVASTPALAETDNEDEDYYEAPEAAAPPAPGGGGIAAMRDPRELPGLALALLALVIGVAPQLLVSFGGELAATELLQLGGLDRTLEVKTFGYVVTAGQWLPTLAWLAVAAVAVLVLVLVPGGARTVKPTLAAVALGEEEAPELAGLPEPADTWSDLGAAFTSPWVVPAGSWLLAGTDEDDGMEDEEEVEDEAASDEEVEGEPAEAEVSEPAEAEVSEPAEAEVGKAADIDASAESASAESSGAERAGAEVRTGAKPKVRATRRGKATQSDTTGDKA
jgi:formate hydrogenlyase subunit 3/multisubunit Na+/H+ antiporter MnhD subunit